MSKSHNLPKTVVVITRVDLADDPLKYDDVVGVFVDKEYALKVLKEYEDELDGQEGFHFFIEAVSLDQSVVQGV